MCFLIVGELVLSNDNIGNGAFGSVFRAEYRSQECAAKMLSHHARDLLSGIKTSRRPVQNAAKSCILKECTFLERLQHKNIIQHFTTILDPVSNLPILVMELMDCNLKHYIDKHGPLQYYTQLFICHGVCCGLHYLHSSDIIHRDLCDDNILLKYKPDLTVKISDFGMSTLLDYESMSDTLTAVAHRAGYLPPEGEAIDDDSDEDIDEEDEYYYNKARYSHRLDIYSFGAVATQVVQSTRHFRNKKQLKKAFKKIEEKHPMKDIISRCLHKDSKQRPGAEAVSKEIATLLDPEQKVLS